MVNVLKLLTIFTKNFILDVWLDSEYPFEIFEIKRSR